MSAGKKLTPKEEIFVLEYLKDFNATRSYYAAGYKAKTDNVAAASAFKNLSKPKIAAAIASKRDAKLAKLGIDIDTVVHELAAIATAKITDFAELVEEEVESETDDPETESHFKRLPKPGSESELDGEDAFDALRDEANKIPNGPDGLPEISKKVTRKFLSLKFKPSKDWDPLLVGAVSSIEQTDKGIKLRFYEKTKATEQLGRYLAMFTDNVKHSGEIKTQNEPDLSVLSNEELAQYIALAKKTARK